MEDFYVDFVEETFDIKLQVIDILQVATLRKLTDTNEDDAVAKDFLVYGDGKWVSKKVFYFDSDLKIVFFDE